MSECIVEVNNLSFTYLHRKQQVLKNINLKIREGEFISVIGPLGAGKTTLLRSFNGVIPYHFPGRLEGDVIVTGTMNTRKNDILTLSRYIGMVLDNPSTQIFNLTVEDDVAFGPINLGLPFDEIEERTKYAIKALRLNGLEDKHPRELSGGQQQRVALAGILAMRPRLIVLDEPISMLDPIGKSEVLSSIKELNRKYNIACVIAESGSDLEEVIQLSTRSIIMKDGEIIFDGPPSDALATGYLEELGIGVPQIAELFKKISSRIGEKLRIPVTIQEAAEGIRKLINEGKIKLNAEKIETHKELFKEEIAASKYIEREPIVVAHNVWFQYPNGTVALKGVSLTIHKGELVAFIGQNGSGKSTLALTLSGALKPTNNDATIIVDGIDAVNTDTTKLITHINYVFQNPDMQLFSANVYEEIVFALKMQGLKPAEIKKRAEEVINMLGIKITKKQIIDLTKDMKTLVALASVLVLKPKVLIVDEPTSGLDRKSSITLMNIFKELRNRGYTIIFITHDMKLVYENADRVVVMNDGEILLDGTPRQVFSQVDILKSAYIKPPQITQLAYALEELEIPTTVYKVDEFLELFDFEARSSSGGIEEHKEEKNEEESGDE